MASVLRGINEAEREIGVFNKQKRENSPRVKVKRGKEADVSDLQEKSHVCVMQEK